MSTFWDDRLRACQYGGAALGAAGLLVLFARHRHLTRGAGHFSHSLQVELRFTWDMEHLYWSDYNEEEGRFGDLWC